MIAGFTSVATLKAVATTAPCAPNDLLLSKYKNLRFPIRLNTRPCRSQFISFRHLQIYRNCFAVLQTNWIIQLTCRAQLLLILMDVLAFACYSQYIIAINSAYFHWRTTEILIHYRFNIECFMK